MEFATSTVALDIRATLGNMYVLMGDASAMEHPPLVRVLACTLVLALHATSPHACGERRQASGGRGGEASQHRCRPQHNRLADSPNHLQCCDSEKVNRTYCHRARTYE